jgi:hypothetical protein
MIHRTPEADEALVGELTAAFGVWLMRQSDQSTSTGSRTAASLSDFVSLSLSVVLPRTFGGRDPRATRGMLEQWAAGVVRQTLELMDERGGRRPAAGDGP